MHNVPVVLSGSILSPIGTELVRCEKLSLPPQSFTAIVGPSGCGKTTLLRAIAGLVAIHGTRECVPRVVMSFQAPTLLPWLSVRANIGLGLGPAVRSRDLEVNSQLARYRLEKTADRLPHQCSGGEKQRAGLARATISRPPILCCDEPFSALDAPLRDEMRKLLLHFWRETGATVVLATHDIDEALAMADTLIVMARGGIRATYALDRTSKVETARSEQYQKLYNEIAGEWD